MSHLSGLTPQWKASQVIAEGRAEHTEFRDKSCNEVSWSDVEGRVPGTGPRSGQPLPPERGDLLRVTFLDRDRIPIHGREINAAARCTHIEGNAVGASHECKVVRAHLVGNITIGSNTITTHQHCIHLTTTHQQTTRSINNHGAGNSQTAELPCRQCSSLKTGTRLIEPGMPE